MRMDRRKQMKIVPRRKNLWIPPPNFQHLLLTAKGFNCFLIKGFVQI